MPAPRERALSLNVVIVADEAAAPRNVIHAADIVVDAKSRCMTKNRFGPCDHRLAHDLLEMPGTRHLRLSLIHI